MLLLLGIFQLRCRRRLRRRIKEFVLKVCCSGLKWMDIDSRFMSWKNRFYKNFRIGDSFDSGRRIKNLGIILKGI